MFYERSVPRCKHEYYGTLQIGNFLVARLEPARLPLRQSDLGQTAFSDSGAAYGILTKALRYTSRELFVADGNLVLEGHLRPWATPSSSATSRELFEFWALWARGPLVVEAIAQSRQERPAGGFAKAPFTGLTPFPDRDDRSSMAAARACSCC